MRIYTLYICIALLGCYAWRDWFKSLCGLILLMAVIQHEDMPKTMLGIQGLNPWNVLFAMILLAWAASRRREGLTWDMPRHITGLLVLYLGVIVIGFLRAVFDRTHIDDSLGRMISEDLVNTVKWAVPGVLLFDGCRTRRRAVTALVCVLTVYFLISLQVVRKMPFEAAFGGGEDIRYIQTRVCTRVGYSACDTSTMLAGAFWGVIAALPLVRRWRYKIPLLGAAGIVAFGQALTGGRAGYVAWGTIGLLLCLLKWRKYLIVAPAIVMLLPVIFPAAAARMLQGFGQSDVGGQTTTDLNSVTSDRILFWPYVIDKIGESPLIGYGREAMKRTGLTLLIEDKFPGAGAPHPHNMYLETLLDNGILGSLPIVLFWGTGLICSARLFGGTNRLYSAVGGLALALMLAQLAAGIGSQHVYPRESTLGGWAAVFLSFRVYVEEKRVLTNATVAEDAWGGQRFPQGQVVLSVH